MNKKNVFSYIAGIATVAVLFTAGYVVFSKTSFLKSFNIQATKDNLPKALVVYSGSMEPAIKTASVVITIPQGSYNQGEIITFTPPGDDGFVTHRIEAKLFPNGVESEPVYLTSGDANEDFDTWEIKDENIIGKVTLTVPYLGYLVDFAKKPQGFLLLVIVPATIFIYEELKSAKREIMNFFKKIKGKRRKIYSGEINLILAKPDKGLPKAAFFIPVIGGIFVLAAFTISYLFDYELSTGNIFGAAETFGPPIAKTLVINEVLPDTDCFQGNTEAQWIELYNGYPYEINPKNFQITDKTNTIDLVTANNLSIPSGGFLLLSHNSAIWIHCWDDNGVQTGNLGGKLDIDVGQLQLIDPDGVVIDTVRWGGEYELDPQQNESIEREPDGKDTTLGADFNEDDFEEKSPPNPGI